MMTFLHFNHIGADSLSKMATKFYLETNFFNSIVKELRSPLLEDMAHYFAFKTYILGYVAIFGIFDMSLNFIALIEWDPSAIKLKKIGFTFIWKFKLTMTVKFKQSDGTDSVLANYEE